MLAHMKVFITSLVIVCFLLTGCVNREWKPDPNDPLQQSIVVNVARLGTASYLDKNSSPLSITRVMQLGSLLEQFNTENALSMSVSELGKAIHSEIDREFFAELTPVQQESIRMLIDTTLLATVQWAQTELDNPVDAAYLKMIALAGSHIKDVANKYVELP